MEYNNLTIEQQDELLRADIFAEESSINDSEEEENTQVEESEQEAEETVTAEQGQEAPKKKSNVAKILAEKNEYKRKASEAEERIRELESSVWQDKQTDVDYLKAIIKQEMAQELETQDFFSRNPEARELKEELDEFRAENPNLSYDRAYKFYLAETNPQALLDEQTKNKLNAKNYSTAWRTPQSLRETKTELTYSDAELDWLIKAGKIRL